MHLFGVPRRKEKCIVLYTQVLLTHEEWHPAILVVIVKQAGHPSKFGTLDKYLYTFAFVPYIRKISLVRWANPIAHNLE